MFRRSYMQQSSVDFFCIHCSKLASGGSGTHRHLPSFSMRTTLSKPDFLLEKTTLFYAKRPSFYYRLIAHSAPMVPNCQFQIGAKPFTFNEHELKSGDRIAMDRILIEIGIWRFIQFFANFGPLGIKVTVKMGFIWSTIIIYRGFWRLLKSYWQIIVIHFEFYFFNYCSNKRIIAAWESIALWFSLCIRITQ